MERVEYITKIEKERGSKVICYLTGDRQQFQTQIEESIIPILFRHLEIIGEQDNIDLFLYTRGGDMVVPVRIVKLIRNYCKKKFSVLIPYKCHSAGTLICLGADEIVMTKIAELTPVDPTSSVHPFNPKIQNPLNPAGPPVMLPISVEDVRSYLAFAKEELDAQDLQIVDLYSKMTNQSSPNNTLHPLALGNVYRVQKMIKIITRRLLNLQFKTTEGVENPTITKIIKEITEDICVHNYPIYFDEAKKIGLKVVSAEDKEKFIWNLFEQYSDIMKLNTPFNPIDELVGKEISIGNYYGAYIESEKGEDAFNFTYEIKKLTQQIPGIPLQNAPYAINVNMSKMQWEKIR